MFKGIKEINDFRIDFNTVWAPTWNHLGPQGGAILALKIGQEPPKTSPKTHLEARTRPEAKNDAKMEPVTSQNEAGAWMSQGALFFDVFYGKLRFTIKE